MKDNLTEIVCILDKSGSMSGLITDVIGGYNRFIEEQRAVPGDANVTLIVFDTTYNIVYSGKPIADVPVLDDKVYYASGMTALLDAVGRGIDEVGGRLSNTPEEERPSKVIFSIMTDGFENSSKEYTKTQIKEKILHQQGVYQWEFIFMGANQDSFLEGGSMGIDLRNIGNYKNTSEGVTTAFCNISSRNTSYRVDRSHS